MVRLTFTRLFFIDKYDIIRHDKIERVIMKQKALRFNNTYDAGSLTFLILKDNKLNRFIGICLEFDLEAEGETASEAQAMIEDYAKLWLENVRQNKLSEELLNKETLEEYWQMVNDLEEQQKSREKTVDNLTSSVKIPILSIFMPYNPTLTSILS